MSPYSTKLSMTKEEKVWCLLFGVINQVGFPTTDAPLKFIDMMRQIKSADSEKALDSLAKNIDILLSDNKIFNLAGWHKLFMFLMGKQLGKIEMS